MQEIIELEVAPDEKPAEHESTARVISRMPPEAENDLRLRLSWNLDAYMRMKGITRSELATAMGVSRNAIGHYLSGIRYPRPEVLKRMAGALGVSILDLTEGYQASNEAVERDRISDEGCRVGMFYDELDEFGRKAVNALLEIELERVRVSRTDR